MSKDCVLKFSINNQAKDAVAIEWKVDQAGSAYGPKKRTDTHPNNYGEISWKSPDTLKDSMGGAVEFRVMHKGEARTCFFYAKGIQFGISRASINEAKKNLDTISIDQGMGAGLTIHADPVDSGTMIGSIKFYIQS